MENKNKIIILLDYRDGFYSSTKYRGAVIDHIKLKTFFEKKGYVVEIQNLLIEKVNTFAVKKCSLFGGQFTTLIN